MIHLLRWQVMVLLQQVVNKPEVLKSVSLTSAYPVYEPCPFVLCCFADKHSLGQNFNE